jgi:single-strand DNA-binding protein
MINKVILIGNLGRDPEIRRLENGAAVAKFPIATNESYRDKAGEWQKITEWHDIVAWRALAERAEQQLHKGNLVYIDGKITHRKWQDKDGNDRYTTEIVANTFRILERRESTGGSSTYGQNFPEETDNMTTTPASAGKSTEAGELDDDLPF